MMYVRTKDGVYEVEQSQLEDDEEIVNCDYGQIHKLEILRKSESLEKLCNEFVLYDDYFNTYGIFDKKIITFEWLQKHLEIYKGMTIYATWRKGCRRR